ncbi:porphobilinogen synthase, partial [Salmonella enterica subsp. enterica serovar Anatum]|nr:porphobilinogen synthase [Salmonella enterica subsp. enterica serovar Anatum]
TELPLGAYQVSGEYAMIKFAAMAGAIDEEKVVLESLGSIKRAIVIIFSLIDSQSKSFSRQIITVIKPYVLCIF